MRLKIFFPRNVIFTLADPCQDELTPVCSKSTNKFSLIAQNLKRQNKDGVGEWMKRKYSRNTIRNAKIK